MVYPYRRMIMEYERVSVMTAREYKKNFGRDFVHFMSTASARNVKSYFPSIDGSQHQSIATFERKNFDTKTERVDKCGGYRLLPLKKQHEWPGNMTCVPQVRLSMIQIPDDDEIIVMKNGSIQVGRFHYSYAEIINIENGYDEAYFTKVSDFDTTLIFIPEKLLTKEMCMKSLTNFSLNARYIPHHMFDEEMAILCASRNGSSIKFIPEKFRKNVKICMIAVKSDSQAIYEVPIEIKQDYKFCLDAIKCGCSLYGIPQENLTQELVDIAIGLDPMNYTWYKYTEPFMNRENTLSAAQRLTEILDYAPDSLKEYVRGIIGKGYIYDRCTIDWELLGKYGIVPTPEKDTNAI